MYSMKINLSAKKYKKVNKHINKSQTIEWFQWWVVSAVLNLQFPIQRFKVEPHLTAPK
jgi:hypothetical protein